VTAVSSALADFARRNRLTLSDVSSIPLYYQLYRLLERFISERHLEPGDRFPAEEAIASAFAVSRPTANRATRELLRRGWLRRERGRGTFVGASSYVELAIQSDELSFSEQFREDRRFTTHTALRRTRPAPDDVSHALDLPEGAPVVELRRVRSIDEHPLLVSDAYLPAERFPALDGEEMVEGSLFSTLREKHGVTVARCERWLGASEVISQDVADLLGVPLLAPILLIKALVYDGNDRPVACTTTYAREGISFRATAHSHPEDGTEAPKTFTQTVQREERDPA
jgi:GntR family transcriptional regulator